MKSQLAFVVFVVSWAGSAAYAQEASKKDLARTLETWAGQVDYRKGIAGSTRVLVTLYERNGALREVDDAAIKALAEFPEITSLHITSGSVTDAGVRELRHL